MPAFRRLSLAAFAVLFACSAVLSLSAGEAHRPIQPSRTAAAPMLDPAILKAFQWRSLGPQRAGRSIAVSGVKGQPKVAYAGAAGGGLWKTVDGGATWAPVTDGQVKSSSVGAVAVSESNPDVVYIGMGESCIRGDILPGDGVYKSTDAGKTWTHVGFAHSQAISRIRIDPTNPDIVYVADFGDYSVPSDERGIFKSIDGGTTWKRTLFRDGKTGGVDIALDRHDPRVLYAALWEAYRVEYQMSSGGPGSGLFKSTDGGDTWTEITRRPGLPSGVDGKIGVAISGADPNRVYALVENANGGLFRSDDGGATWTLVNDDHIIRQRAFYYTHVFADPHDKDLVYALDTGVLRSTDGGKTMTNFAGGDSHDLWIDPDDSNHVVHGNDQGAAITYDASSAQRTWSARDYPTGQFYHVITTKNVPYHVCGAQQDNSTWCVSSEPAGRGFGRGSTVEPYSVGGAEPGYIAPDPLDPDVFYAGGNNGSFLTRLDRHTGELKEVGPYPRFFSGEPSSALVERWQWTYPIVFSPVDPHVLYAASQHVWRTKDAGQTWDKISPDLTRHDPKTMGPSGGPITHDMNSPEVYGTVFALGPGKTDVNILWTGSDDGLVQMTRDGGTTWTNVTPKEMPDLGRVSQIDASAFDPGAAYVAVKKPLLNDFAPYVFRTHDFGRTWTKIVEGIAPGDYVHVVREDPTRRGLLYAGTEHGVYVSYDDGDHWQSLSLNLPDTQVSDIWVEAKDLVISTHGRGFYVLDDVGPLRQAAPDVTSAAHLFEPADATRGTSGAMISYYLPTAARDLSIDILDANGKIVHTIKGAPPRSGRGGRGAEAGRGRGRGGPVTASTAAGLDRVTWNLRYPDATTFPGMILWGATTNGPEALPGNYQVRLTVDGRSETQPLVVRKHPLRNTSDADLRAQFDIASQIRDKVSEANEAVIHIRKIKDAVTNRLANSPDAGLKAAGDTLTGHLSAIEEEIYQVRNQSGQDPLNFPIKINNRLASLLRVAEAGDGRPTANVYPIFKDLTAELKVQTDRLQQVLSTDLTAFNAAARRAGVDPISGS
ncbi:MAG TPA: hypothetical protein VFX12_03060 [Vicinamibacterales bacterium]|nr:hypothetical protein [Vicinamibacterales bacterium]